MGALRHPIISNLQDSWSKVSHAARELATVFSVTFSSFLVAIVGQFVERPPNGKCLGTSLTQLAVGVRAEGITPQ